MDKSNREVCQMHGAILSILRESRRILCGLLRQTPASADFIEEALSEPDATPPSALWAAVGNIKRTCRRGHGGAEETPGTKHFRGGAKVYVIDAFWGTCDTVTVIGRHRKSRRLMCLHMRARHIENLRVKPVYSPAIASLMREHYAESGQTEPPGKEYAERIAMAISLWVADDGWE